MGGIRKLGLAAVGMAMGFAATQALAGVVTINFAGNGGLQSGSSMVFTNAGVSVTVTAGATALSDEFNIASRIGQYSGGLGNTSSYSYTDEVKCYTPGWNGCGLNGKKIVTYNVADTNHEVDDAKSNGQGVREFLLLDFAGLNVQLTNIDFEYHDYKDSAVVTVNNNSTQIYSGTADPISSLAAHTATNLFWVVAGIDSKFDNDWKLRSVTFSFADPVEEPGPDPQQEEEVPAPAALSILGLGLAGLGILRRRRG